MVEVRAQRASKPWLFHSGRPPYDDRLVTTIYAIAYFGSGPNLSRFFGFFNLCVTATTGIALSGAGGMLPPLAALTRAGLGGRIGSGRQWMSWISLDDLTDIYLLAIVDPQVSGPVNATAPEPVTNAEFTRVLGAVLRRPTLIPVPRVAPALLLGSQGADELALADQRILPRALSDAGQHFRHPGLRAALEHELGAEELPTAL